VAVLTVLAVTAAACGGGDDTTSSGRTDPVDEGRPVRGGEVVYGVEASNSDGFCLPESQQAISGWLVTMSVYDPLVYLNEDGALVPVLAESVTPNRDATQWTITLRPDITFHDGSPLDAEVVKLNLDSYRGVNDELRPALSPIVFQDIADVRVTGPLTVTVRTKRPWVSFPAYLFLTGRMGIAARAQLSDRESCARNMIGTGPFRLQGSWTPGTPIELVRNEDYWREDASGTPLPYLDALTFVGVPEQSQRINELLGGQLQLVHSAQQADVNKFREIADDGRARVYVADQGREVRYYMLNAGRAPFSDLDARQAFAYAVDMEEMNLLRNGGEATLANGPFDRGVPGHLERVDNVEYDLDRAKELVEQVKARNGGRFDVTFAVNPDSGSQAEAEILAEMVEAAGISVTMERVDQATEINRALAGDFDVLLWRLHPGEDPDTQYIWWHSGYPTNFNHFEDREIDRALDTARVTLDEEERRAHYEALNRRFAQQSYNVWSWYADWAVATSPDVRGVLGPPLPDGSAPYPLIGGLHPTAGLWLAP
jgi:peptide/nickel transport system substrate-binding protein